MNSIMKTRRGHRTRIYMKSNLKHSLDRKKFPKHKIAISFLCTGDVWFSLRNTTYQNNSLVTLEDIGENDTALFCMTQLNTCCRSGKGSVLGQWFFPNGTHVPSIFVNNTSQPKLKWDFYRTREKMMVLLHRRGGGVAGIYRCKIPDSMNVTQNIYIGVYTSSSGEWHCTLLFCFNFILLCVRMLKQRGDWSDKSKSNVRDLFCITYM